MNKRKNKIIDKKLQLKTAFSIVGITFFASLLVIAVIGLNAKNNYEEINNTVKSLNETIETESNIVKSFIKYSKSVSGSSIVLYTKKISTDHDKSIKTIEDQIKVLENFTYKNFLNIVFIIFIFFFLSIFLYLYIIKLTHKIFGPIYVINRRLEEMNNGISPNFRTLRKGDKFTKTYGLLIQLNEKINGYN